MERVYPPGYSRTWCSMSGVVTGLLPSTCFGWSGGSDRGLAFGPVRVAQLALEQLAGRLARQLVDEVDRAGPLELREPALQELHDRGPQRVVRDRAFAHLDDGLDLLAHVVVGDAEHRDVGDVRVRLDLALDLGRV